MEDVKTWLSRSYNIMGKKSQKVKTNNKSIKNLFLRYKKFLNKKIIIWKCQCK